MPPSPHTRPHNCPLTEDDLWCSVVASGDNGAVVFVVEGGTAEVHHPHGRALHAALVPLLGTNGGGGDPLHTGRDATALL